MNFTTADSTRDMKRGDSIKVQEVTFENHVGNIFLIRPASATGKTADVWFRACGRCSGYGHYSYMREFGTYCFDCMGSGLGEVTTPEDAAKLMKTRQAAKARKERAEFLAAWDAAIEWNGFYGQHADVIAFLADKIERRGFLGDMAAKIASGIVLSENMVNAVRKIAAEVAGKQAAANAAGHFGEVGTRYTITALVTNVSDPIYSDYGTSYLITMRGEDGHTFKTFASGAFADVEKNTTVTFKGTVKGHGEWNGSKETTLTRCMIPKKKA